MVGCSDDVGVVLDDDDGVASVEEGAEGGEEFLDVVEVEAGGGFVEDEEDRLVGLAGASGGTGTGWSVWRYRNRMGMDLDRGCCHL